MLLVSADPGRDREQAETLTGRRETGTLRRSIRELGSSVQPKPGEMPIEQAATFSLKINRTTAMLPEITKSKELLVRADEVIE